jgi:hypothetical protein
VKRECAACGASFETGGYGKRFCSRPCWPSSRPFADLDATLADGPVTYAELIGLLETAARKGSISAMQMLLREVRRDATGRSDRRRPGIGEADMAKIPEPSIERRGKKLIVEVPRTPDRSTLRQCRARAKVIAAREGVRTEPEVSPYDGRPSALGGPMSNPQGWIFTFDLNGDEPKQDGRSSDG